MNHLGSYLPSLDADARRRRTKMRWIRRSLAAGALIASGPLGLAGQDTPATTVVGGGVRSHVAARAAGRGTPYLNLRDGYALGVAYRGEPGAMSALQSGAARPLALATADFDQNGTPDVVAGYAVAGGGILTVQRGNPDAFAPADDSVLVRMQKGYDPESLLPVAEVLALPAPPHFLAAGRFTRDSEPDVLFAAMGGALYLMTGDGTGGFSEPREIPLPGVVTALAAGEFRALDGFTDLAVGVSARGGGSLLVFDAAEGEFAAPLVELPLAAPASAIELGGLDSDPFMDVAAAAGSEVVLVHGWGRREDVQLESRVERIEVGPGLRGLAVGGFVWDRHGRSEIAALSEQGTLHIVARADLDTRPFSAAEAAQRTRANLRPEAIRLDVETAPSWRPRGKASWRESSRLVALSPASAEPIAASPLRRANLSYRETDDLLLLDERQARLEIVRAVAPLDRAPGRAAMVGSLQATTLGLASPPVAVLPLPRKLNGVRDLLVLDSTQAAVTVIANAPNTTITVDRTDDPSGAGLTAASACTAAANDCSLRGALQFANLPQNNNTTISLPANTYILSINGTAAGGCDGNTVGDLGANRTMSIVGAGAATTIVRQTGTGPANDGDRVMCMNEPFTANLVYNFSGVTFVGGRDGTAAGTGTALGGGGIIGGEQANSLTLTSVVLANNQVTVLGSANLGGGGIQITGGDLIITNSTIGGTSAPGLYTDRTSTTTANLQGGSGGGVTFTPSSPMSEGGTGVLTVTGSTFSRNTAAGIGGGGADLLIFAFADPGGIGSGSASISTSTFSNNQATGTGGAIVVESLPTIVATTSLSNNSAGNRGGGIYVGGGSLTLNGTTPSVTLSGNTATNAGSSISTAGPVTVQGTNTTIGGDIEITTGGTWTNDPGSALAPTNVVVTGGTVHCNNSTMDIGGSLTIEPGLIVGATFNGGSATVNVAGNFTFTAGNGTAFNAGTSTFVFDGAAAQSISNTASITFHHLTDSNTSQPLTLNNSLAVNGTLNVSGANAVLSPAAGAIISGTGTLTGTGTARVTRTAATPDFLSQYSIANKTLANLTIDYSGAGNQTVNNTPAYRHLRISGSGVKTLQGNTSISGNLTIAAATLASGNFGFSLGGNWTNNATFTPGTGTVTFAGTSGTQLLAGNTTFFDLTLNNAGATTGFGNTTTTIGNDLVATAGTMDGGTSTLVFTGATDSAGAIGGAAAKNFHNLQIDSPAVISNLAGGNLTIENNFTNGGGFNQAAGVTTIFATDNNGDGAHASSGAGTTTFGNVTIDAGNSVDGGSHGFSVGGASFAVAGTFNGNANTVTFNGAVPQSISGDGTKSFSGLVAGNPNGLTLGNGVGAVDASVAGILTLTHDLTVAPGAVLQQGGTSAGAADVLGTVRRTDLGAAPRAFGNLGNTVAIASGTPPSALDLHLVKAAPGTFPATVKVVPRTVTLTPTGGSGLSATLKLRYIDPAELAGPSITESRLLLWKDLGGGAWAPQGGTVDAAADTVTLLGVGSFSAWALAEGSDLTLGKTNSVGGAAVTGQAWSWTLTATNTGAPFTFTDGQSILTDTLPSSGLTYGPVVVQNVSNVTGSANIDCAITGSDLACTADGGSVTFASNVGASGFEVVVSATPQVAGAYQNPRSGGSAQIDPANVVVESNEGNNAPAANTVTVGKAGTTTAIVSDTPDPSVVGEAVTAQWNVAVSAPGAVGAALTGNVTVSDGTVQCVAAVSAGQCPITFTTPGAKSLVATYAGDANYDGSASTPATLHDVNQAATTTTITADDPDPSTPGQSVTVEWTLTVDPPGAGTPTGDVDVTVSGGAETCSAAAAAGQCSLVLNALGARTITATYEGDTSFATSADTEDHQVCGGTLVTTAADSGAGSLREIVANACDGATITFDAAGVFAAPQTITLTSGEIVIGTNLSINAGASRVAISGNAASRGFRVASGKTAGIVGLTLQSGAAADGGAILNEGALTLANATLAGSAATGNGGAVASSATATSLTLVNVTLSGNTAAGSGGGVALAGGTLTSINSTITGNVADSDGDGAGAGGGIHIAAGTATLHNTIVAGNSNEDGASDAADDLSGTADVASSFNLIGTGGSGGLADGVNGNQVGVVDAGLGALGDNGGLVETHTLAPASPAIEAGSNAVLPLDAFDLDGDATTAEPLPVDGRGPGFPRVADAADVDVTATVDVGAFELHPALEDIANQTTTEDSAELVTFHLGDDTGALIASVAATSSNTTLVASDGAHLSFTGTGGSRTLTVTPNADANSPADGGVTTITVTTTATNGRTASDTFDLTVTEINDAPDAVDDLLTAIAEDSGTRSVPFADLIGNDSAGPANEAGQSLTVILADNPVGGTVAINGSNVEFAPAADFFGAASFGYTIVDDGTTNGVAAPLSDTATAGFTIDPVNDAPSFAIAADPPSVTIDAGPQAVNGFATNISQGPGESGQVLTFQLSAGPSTGSLTFSSAPAIDPNGTLTYTASAGTSGTATFGVTLSDDGSDTPPNSNTSASQSFTISVLGGPGVASAFAPASIPSGGTATFTVTLANGNGTDVTGAAFTNTFPAGVTLAGAPAAATTCAGGAVTPAGDGLSFAFAGGTVPANGSCTVSVDVTSAVAGTHTNTIAAGAVTTSNAGANGAPSQATLEVLAAPIVAKAFDPTTIVSGGSANLTVTLSNANASAITGAAFDDLYPAGVSNAAAAPTTNTCGGTVTTPVGGGQLQLAGGTIPASGSCEITIAVTSTSAGTHTNTIAAGDVTSGNAPPNADSASASLTVESPPTAVKSFAAPSVPVGSTSTLSIVITNPNPMPMDGVAFTDTYPAGFANAATPAASSSCGGSVVATPGGGSLAFAGGTIGAGASCTVSVTVIGTSAGNHVNTIPAGGITSISFPATTTAVSATLSVGLLAAPAVTKTFTPSAIPPGGTSVLTITLANPEADAVTGVAFLDTYPAAITNVAPADAATTCPGGAVTATDGGGSLELAGASIPASSSCTVTTTVTATTVGDHVNTLPAGGITATNAAPNGSPVAATLTVAPLDPLEVAKAFSPATIPPGGSTTLTITVTNPNPSPITGVAFTDDFPSGLLVAPTPNAASTCGGTVTALPDTSSISFSGGVIAPDGACAVSVAVVASSSGSFSNVIPAGGVTSANAPASSGAASATLLSTTAAEIPALSTLAMLALAALLAGLALAFLRR